MTTPKSGGPAFPFAPTDPSNVPMQAQGMTLRDWFAGQALAAEPWPDQYVGDEQTAAALRKHVARAFKIADAMLTERPKL